MNRCRCRYACAAHDAARSQQYPCHFSFALCVVTLVALFNTMLPSPAHMCVQLYIHVSLRNCGMSLGITHGNPRTLVMSVRRCSCVPKERYWSATSLTIELAFLP